MVFKTSNPLTITVIITLYVTGMQELYYFS